MGPVCFLASVGWLYAVSITIFFYLLVQYEARIKKLRDDSVLREMRSYCARRRWEKLRKHVLHTGHPNISDVKKRGARKDSLMIEKEATH